MVVLTHDLAKGVVFGVSLSGLFFAHKVTRFFAVISDRDDTTAVRIYRVTGQIFFATTEAFHSALDFREGDLNGVVMNEATATMVERLGTHDKAGAVLAAPGH